MPLRNKQSRHLPNDITLLAFTPTPTQQYMSAAERNTHELFTLRFALPLDSMPKIKGLNFDESTDYILQHSARYDTLVFWMKDTAVYYQDTLSFAITYLATDTANILSPRTDTLNLVPKKTHERILKEQARKAEDEKKEFEKQLRRLERAGDSLGIAKLMEPKVKFLEYKLTAGGSLSIYQQITLSFNEPVSFLSDTAFHLYQKVDTIWKSVPFEIEQDSLDILRYYIYGEWKPEESFKFTIDSASIQGLYGLHNDDIETSLKFNALNKYSTLTVNVANPKPGYTVRLHNTSGKVLRSQKLENGSVDFFLLQPATYYISMFDDMNGNGKWDTGEYEEKRHAESVWYIKRSWVLKQDWTHETDLWYVNEYPLTQQKPDQLSKEKTKKKETDIHKKNVERLEKKSQQAESEKKKKEKKRQERKDRRQKNKEKYREIRANAKAKKAQSKADVSSPDTEEITSPDE